MQESPGWHTGPFIWLFHDLLTSVVCHGTLSHPVVCFWEALRAQGSPLPTSPVVRLTLVHGNCSVDGKDYCRLQRGNSNQESNSNHALLVEALRGNWKPRKRCLRFIPGFMNCRDPSGERTLIPCRDSYRKRTSHGLCWYPARHPTIRG